MNIFVLDFEPQKAASMHCDQHLNKMILEGAQMLSTTARLTLGEDSPFVQCLYKKTHENHPCRKWVGESADNAQWLFELLFWLNVERYYRFGTHTKDHKSLEIARQAINCMKHRLPALLITPYPQAMPEQYHNVSAVTAYRDYYAAEKMNLGIGGKPSTWTRRGTPYWSLSETFSKK